MICGTPTEVKTGREQRKGKAKRTTRFKTGAPLAFIEVTRPGGVGATRRDERSTHCLLFCERWGKHKHRNSEGKQVGCCVEVSLGLD